jgi:hypothetical protein
MLGLGLGLPGAGALRLLEQLEQQEGLTLLEQLEPVGRSLWHS